MRYTLVFAALPLIAALSPGPPVKRRGGATAAPRAHLSSRDSSDSDHVFNDKRLLDGDSGEPYLPKNKGDNATQPAEPAESPSSRDAGQLPYTEDWRLPIYDEDSDRRNPSNKKDKAVPPATPQDGGVKNGTDGGDKDGTNSDGNSPAKPAQDFAVAILADTNRDGTVDVDGDTDMNNKNEALILANIVDTDRRCSSQISGFCADVFGDLYPDDVVPPEAPVLDTSSRSFPDIAAEQAYINGLDDATAENLFGWKSRKDAYYSKVKPPNLKIAACNDASDNVLRNETYLAPLRTRPIPNLGDEATATVAVTRVLAASKVRIFRRDGSGGQWVFVPPEYTFAAAELRAGLTLGVDARDVRRPGGWDGRATVEFKVRDGEREARASVALRVAPVLAQHHAQDAMQLIAVRRQLEEGNYEERQDLFIENLKNLSPQWGLEQPMHVFLNCTDDSWTRDFFKPGYMSIPGPSGPISLHIMIRSPQYWRDKGRLIFQDLRSNTIGAVQHPGNGSDEDATGNLEVIPPYSHDGKSYPTGRVVMGSKGESALMMSFINAQETQAPIELDVSWLILGHVDEFIQFLPADNKLGWVVMVSDPLRGLDILRKAQEDGYGRRLASMRPLSLPAPELNGSPGMKLALRMTINQVLASPDFDAIQKKAAECIQRNLDILKRETPLTDAEIIRVPSLFSWKKTGSNKPGSLWFYKYKKYVPPEKKLYDRHVPSADAASDPLDEPLPQRLPADDGHKETTKRLRRRQGFGPIQLNGQPFTVTTLYPQPVNSVVVGKRGILVSNPWGPRISGRDILAVETEEAYAKAGYKVTFVDDWYTQHVGGGNLHCATNMIRKLPTSKWWEEM